MRDCKTVGTLIVPMWKSAQFWPLVCNDGVHLNPFTVGTECLKIAEVRHSQRSAVFRENSLSPKFKMASFMSCEKVLEENGGGDIC